MSALNALNPVYETEQNPVRFSPIDTPPFQSLKTALPTEKASGMSRQTPLREIDCSAALKTPDQTCQCSGCPV